MTGTDSAYSPDGSLDILIQHEDPGGPGVQLAARADRLVQRVPARLLAGAADPQRHLDPAAADPSALGPAGVCDPAPSA